MGNLQYKIDIEDKDTFLCSEGLVSTADEAGSLVTFDDGSIDIASSYGDMSSSRCDIRYLQGLTYFGADTEYSFDEETGELNPVEKPQQFFEPGRENIDLFTALRAFAARGEQDQAINANVNSDLYAIGNNRNVETHLFQIRQGLDPEIAVVQWEALSRGEFSVFIPSYSALISEVSPVYGDIEDFDETHGSDEKEDSVEQALFEDNSGLLDYVMMDINTLCYNNRGMCAEYTRMYLDEYQKQLIVDQEKFDEEIKKAAPADREEMATTHFAEVSEQVYKDMDALRGELISYVNTGDFTEQFVPSALTVEVAIGEPSDNSVDEVKSAEKDPSFTTSIVLSGLVGLVLGAGGCYFITKNKKQ